MRLFLFVVNILRNGILVVVTGVVMQEKYFLRDL